MVHYSSINYPLYIFKEIVLPVKLLEVINKCWNSKSTESGLTVLKDVRKFQIKLLVSAEFHDINDEHFVDSSDGQYTWSEDIYSIQII